MHAARALPPAHALSRLQPTPRSTSYALLPTRQRASAFNQPLSFDTSSVTDMSNMFQVRSARESLGPLPVHTTCVCTAPPPSHLSGRTSPRTSFALLVTRQHAKVFNQPLSFDTSSIKTMSGMFRVRSARVLAPSL